MLPEEINHCICSLLSEISALELWTVTTTGAILGRFEQKTTICRSYLICNRVPLSASPQSRVLCDDSDCDSAELDQSGSGEPSRPPSAGAWLPPSQSYQGSAQVPPSGPP